MQQSLMSTAPPPQSLATAASTEAVSKAAVPSLDETSGFSLRNKISGGGGWGVEEKERVGFHESHSPSFSSQSPQAAFGTPAPVGGFSFTSTSGQATLGFGSGSLFSQSKQPELKDAAPPSTGVSSGFGGLLKAAAPSSTGVSFGSGCLAAAPSSTGVSFGSGLFGQSKQTGLKDAAPPSTGVSSVFGGLLKAAAPSSTGVSFGSGLFGQSKQTGLKDAAPPSTGVSFGSGSLFGQSKQTGLKDAAPPSTGVSFGSGSLFGQSKQTGLKDAPFRFAQPPKPTAKQAAPWKGMENVPFRQSGSFGSAPQVGGGWGLFSRSSLSTVPPPLTSERPALAQRSEYSAPAPLITDKAPKRVSSFSVSDQLQEEILTERLTVAEAVEEAEHMKPIPLPRTYRQKAIPASKTKDNRDLFKQTPEGFWNVDDLPVIGINTGSFIELLESAGARSLGPKTFEAVQRLLATLMMLAFIKLRLCVEFPLTLPPGQAFEVNVDGLVGEPYSKDITRALKWIKIQERTIPLLYSRLEFGANWEAATQTIVQKMNI
ncbi:Protein mono-ADP-ribosyltransferase parp4 [Desmophyllum pertusum]|uniref:Protein mono-ADP-ribosyltransferase parp4 n=1 Tax=Desmophyllum pertusum TaxID=174260 RepID=A0A9X0DAY8_9CNID|nr:Protein mono-ADP-ribosyltransferase parp4 [Desmophyllum pertusum]